MRERRDGRRLLLIRKPSRRVRHPSNHSPKFYFIKVRKRPVSGHFVFVAASQIAPAVSGLPWWMLALLDEILISRLAGSRRRQSGGPGSQSGRNASKGGLGGQIAATRFERVIHHDQPPLALSHEPNSTSSSQRRGDATAPSLNEDQCNKN
jgi:hypothetical protein